MFDMSTTDAVCLVIFIGHRFAIGSDLLTDLTYIVFIQSPFLFLRQVEINHNLTYSMKYFEKHE